MPTQDRLYMLLLALVGVVAYVNVGVDGNVVLSVPNFRLIILKVM